MTAPHCGRLDPHPAHEWTGWSTAEHTCPGTVEVEGGGLPLCRTCGEQPASPWGIGECRWCLAGRYGEEA